MQPDLNQTPVSPTPQGPEAMPTIPAQSKKAKSGKLATVLAIIALLVIGVVVYLANPGGIFSPRAASQTTPQVVITDSGFTPATLKIKKGQAVEWVNNDTKGHQVVADEGANAPHLDAEPLAQGDSYSFTFDTPGTYTYHDQQNPLTFKGTVIVEQ